MRMTIDELLKTIAADAACRVHPPAGKPHVEPEHTLPLDVRRFYQQCGGVDLFPEDDYSQFVLPPHEVRLANPVLVGERVPDDRSDSWYLITHDGNGDYLTLDCGAARNGWCYDSFHETHGLIGQTPIIARSFTELLTRCYANRGGYLYWLRDDFVSFGDAYDP